MQCLDKERENNPIQEDNEDAGNKHLLIVDDEAGIRRLLTRHLTEEGYECIQAKEGMEALELLKLYSFDAVLSDLEMPGMNGFELTSNIKAHNDQMAIIMITGHQEMQDAIAAMKMGADDYILKPVNCSEVSISLKRALEKKDLKEKVRNYQMNLEHMVNKRTAQAHRLFINVIKALVYSLEAKDSYTNGHSSRVTWLALRLGKEAGLESRDLEILQLGGMFHDLGKIGIRESVLLKPQSLTQEEFQHIKEHPDIAIQILTPLKELHGVFPTIRHHHERYDGKGYPLGLRGEEIPITARVISIADTFDAMTSERPYRKALPLDTVVSHLGKEGGLQLDPWLLDLFLQMVKDRNLYEVLNSQMRQPNSTGIENMHISDWLDKFLEIDSDSDSHPWTFEANQILPS